MFGSLFSASWTPSRAPVPSEASASAALLAAGAGSCGAASGSAARLPAAGAAEPGLVPIDEPDQAVAPWVTGPRALAPWAVASSSGGSGGAAGVAAAPLEAPGGGGGGGGGGASGGAGGGAGGGRAVPSPGSGVAPPISDASGPGPSQSTVHAFLDAFGNLPHISPAAAAAAAAEEEEGASLATEEAQALPLGGAEE